MVTSSESQIKTFKVLFLKLLAPTFPRPTSLARQVKTTFLFFVNLDLVALDLAALPFLSSQTQRRPLASSSPTWWWSSRTWRSISLLRSRWDFGWVNNFHPGNLTQNFQVLDDKNVRRRFRASNYQSTTRCKYILKFSCVNFHQQGEALYLHNAHETRWWLESNPGDRSHYDFWTSSQ